MRLRTAYLCASSSLVFLVSCSGNSNNSKNGEMPAPLGGNPNSSAGMSASAGAATVPNGGQAMAPGGAGAVAGSPSSPDKPPPHTVTPCPAVGASGTGKWEDVTPPGLDLGEVDTPAGQNFGVHAFVVNPQDNATVYVGSSAEGIFKTTDCGASWEHVSHGDVDKGRNGSMVIDPQDPNVLYTDGRYGPPGLFKTVDGAKTWEQILPSDISDVFVYGGVIEWIAMDPDNHLHLTVSPHFTCEGAHGPDCWLETFDGGTKWNVIDKTPPSDELGGQIMLTPTKWLALEPFNGIFLTDDGGKSWKKVYEGQAFPYHYQAPDGTLYVPGGNGGILKGTADATKWTTIASSMGSAALTFTKNALFASLGLNGSAYSMAPLDKPDSWTALDSAPPGDSGGGWMIHADVDHNLVYASAFRAGFWRYSAK